MVPPTCEAVWTRTLIRVDQIQAVSSMLTRSRLTLVHVDRAVVSCERRKLIRFISVCSSLHDDLMRQHIEKLKGCCCELAYQWNQADSGRWSQLPLHMWGASCRVQAASRSSGHLNAGNICHYSHREAAHTRLYPPGSSLPHNLEDRVRRIFLSS